MTHLETLYSKPHPSFIHYTDEYLIKYLSTEFEVNVSNLDTYKEFINYFSYLLIEGDGLQAYVSLTPNNIKYRFKKFNFSLPPNYDILNYTTSLYIKLSKKDKIYKNAGNVENVDVDTNIKDLLNINLVATECVRTHGQIKRVSDITKIPSFYKLLPDLHSKLITRRFLTLDNNTDKHKVGYLYIDYSASMVKYRKFLIYLADSVDFKDTTVKMYFVVKNSVMFYADTSSKKDFIQKVDKLANKSIACKIDFNKVISHSKRHSFMSTFITDAEDFDKEVFMQSTNKFNLLIVQPDGKFKKYNT